MTNTNYCSLARFRAISGFDTNAVSDTTANLFLTQAHNQILREAYYKIRQESTTKNSNNYYFLRNKYIADSNLDGTIGSADITVYEFDNTNSLWVDISNQVATIDGFNNYYTLNTGYPTQSRSVYTTYFIARQPLTELIGEGGVLEEAVCLYTEILTLKQLKTLRLKRGIVSWSSSGQSCQKSEADVNDLIKLKEQRYKSLISIIKPFIGHKARIGRGERPRTVSTYAPITNNGRIEYGGDYYN